MRGYRIGWGAVALTGSDVYNRADMTWDYKAISTRFNDALRHQIMASLTG